VHLEELPLSASGQSCPSRWDPLLVERKWVLLKDERYLPLDLGILKGLINNWKDL
jgi:hypothetical protein